MKDITDLIRSLNMDLHSPYATFGYYIKAIFYHTKVIILIDFYENDFIKFYEIEHSLMINFFKK